MAETTTVRVRVTQEDIDAGVRYDCCRCPVALALLAALPPTLSVVVWATGATLLALPRLHGVADVEFPRDVIDRIFEFDRGNGMTPFEFDLPLPTEPEVAVRVEGER